MRKVISAIAVGCVILLGSVSANALTFTFNPHDSSGQPNDMLDLDHNYYYEWLFNWVLPAGQELVSATLTIEKIYNWDTNANVLNIHLVDTYYRPNVTGSTDIWRKYDAQGDGDNWAAWPRIGTPYTDYDGSRTKDTLVFNFSDPLLDTLNSYLVDGKFGIGFDPDCHYYNDKITFTITTKNVPEPGTLLLLGTGLLGLGLLRRRTKT